MSIPSSFLENNFSYISLLPQLTLLDFKILVITVTGDEILIIKILILPFPLLFLLLPAF